MSPAARAAAGAAVLILLLAVVVVVSGNSGDRPGGVSETATVTTSPTRSANRPVLSPTPSGDVSLLTDVDAAAVAGPAALRAAFRQQLEREPLVVDTWAAPVAAGLDGWPAVVGEATITMGGAVEADVVLAGLAPPRAGDPLVLRLLPAAAVLGDVGLDVAVTAGGEDLVVDVDRDGARLLVSTPPADHDVTIRVRLSYQVPDAEDIQDDGGPAGFGLLSRTDDVTALGHWLPLPTLPEDDGPMLARGDVGAFPVAAWSLVVHHDDRLVTGGVETACPEPGPAGCTWVQGAGLRDVSAVVVTEAVEHTATAGSVELVATTPDTVASAETDALLAFAASSVAAFEDWFGALPWPELDVVPIAFAGAAAGMEFPGMVWIRRGDWGPTDFGRYVAAHEVGHQWFHALVGNGSLSAPVVDESLAQYLAYLAFADVLGQRQADALAERSLGGRHAAAVAAGTPDEAPAMPLHEFSSAEAYGAAVYGRGGQAWVDAERQAGRDAVVAVVAALVERFGLAAVDVAGVLEVADDEAPEVAAVLRDGWGVSPSG